MADVVGNNQLIKQPNIQRLPKNSLFRLESWFLAWK